MEEVGPDLGNLSKQVGTLPPRRRTRVPFMVLLVHHSARTRLPPYLVNRHSTRCVPSTRRIHTAASATATARDREGGEARGPPRPPRSPAREDGAEALADELVEVDWQRSVGPGEVPEIQI